jgi:hypothetical protein
MTQSLLRLFLVATALLGTLAMVGCVAWSPPEIETPASWQGGNALPTTVVTLQNQHLAQLVDFPQGVTQADEDGHSCLAITGESYTGDARWRALDPYAIEVQFDDSVVTIWSGPAVFGSQDWSELRWRECSSPEILTLWALAQ